MTDHEQNPKNSRGCMLYGCLLIVGLPLLLVVLIVLLVVGREASGKRQLQDKIAALKAAGMPFDSDSLQQYYQQQTDPQHTQRWLSALKTLSSQELQQSALGVPQFDGKVQSDVPLPDQVWDEPTETATRKFLEQWRNLHQEIYELSLHTKPVRFPINFDGMDTTLTHVQEMRQAARLLNLKGKVALRDNDSAEVGRAIEGMLGMTHVLTADAFIVSQLVVIAIDGISLNLLKDGLHSDVLQPAELRKFLPSVLAQIEIGDTWRTGMIGERAFALPTFNNTVQVVGATIPGRSRDALLYLEFSQRAIELPTENLDEFRAAAQRLEYDLQQGIRSSLLRQLDSIMTSALIPAYSATADAHVRRAVQHRLAAIAIGLRLFEQQHGQFPASLAELSQLELGLEQLGPAVGKSFGYRVDSRGMAQVWSHNQREPGDAIPPQPYDTSDPESNNAMWVWELKP